MNNEQKNKDAQRNNDAAAEKKRGLEKNKAARMAALDKNPRPEALYRQFYILSAAYWF